MGGELNILRASRNKSIRTVKGVESIDLKGDGNARGLRMRLYKPILKSKKRLPLLVYFHGGGWTIGSIESCSKFCEALAATGKLMVLAVDYSLAPEHPFPDGLNDCESSIEYAVSHADGWGSSKNMVSVGGDSSGGNLALAAAMNLLNKKSLQGGLRSIVLIYPVVKAYNDKSASWKKYSRGYGLDGRLMETFNEAYLSGSKPTENLIKDPRVSPSHAKDSDLKKLPPVLMISAERDILSDQGKAFTDRLSKLGKSAERIVFPGAVHTFITKEGQPTAFRKAVELVSLFLNVSNSKK